ncbi:mammalian cell entry protein [Mycolicibacterium fortuitum]|uniref:MlaD family protein n=1 Tax=Mycolicibacterium fortuitum TaxID=1766 RepID=UPI0007EBFCB5|nr:MCE family protein [Mycolicibacterium fortuitum]OBG47665.1 mammalian cell entry protein [Mycolicibacterium fortuitum]
MANIFEMDGRGPTTRQLVLVGAAVVLVFALATALLLAKSTGRLENYVRVAATMINVGDGLPQKSDVKYRGLLVGSVASVVPGANGHPNLVHIDLNPAYASSIPASVTARVVPSNVFAVSSVQLVDRGSGPPIRSGDRISEDQELPTVLFQTTISKLRDILAATGRGREDKTVGILAAVNAATQNRRGELLASGAQLNALIDQLNAIVSTNPDDTTASALVNATKGLQQTAPELLDALHEAVRPMQTLVEKRAQLTDLIGGGVHTMDTTSAALRNHSDQLVQITGELTPVFGVLAMQAHNFVPAFTKLNALTDKFFGEVWMPDLDTGNMRVNLSFTPSYTYSRADCPQYGELKGPSCYTAPLIPVRPDLPETLLPQNFQPPANLAPPPGTVVGPNGNLVAVGPPLVNAHPNLADPNPPLPPGFTPAPPVPATANPAFAPPQQAPVADAPQTLPLPAEAAPASYGGNVGPVGSLRERRQLGIITGQPASTATQLLLGPLARGTTVSVTDTADSEGAPR